MPFSTPIFKEDTKNFIYSKFSNADTFLDIGAGAGTYGNLLREKFKLIDAVEVHAPYIEEYKLKDIYRNVYNKNALEIKPGWYSCIILGDVLEHISEEDGIKLVSDLYVKCDELIICIPFNSEQGVHFDNTYEIHLQTKLTNESFLEKYKGFRPLALRYDYGIYIKNNKANQNVPVVYDIYEGKKISHFDDDLNPVYQEKSNLTIVTGLWDIGRPQRDFSIYIDRFNELLDTNVNLFIYLPKSLEHLVWKKRKPHNTFVKIYELDQIKSDIYSPHWDKTQEIRTNPDWYNQVDWLAESPQAKCEWYNPIVQSKMFFLHSASIWNPFSTDYFVWLDAGITRTVFHKYFTEHNVLNKLTPYLDTFFFLSYPYKADKEIHGFDYKAMNRYAKSKVEYVCRGGLFGGSKSIINEANSTYYGILQSSLNEGYMGTEESIFSIMAYNQPAIYRRYALDENGLIVKFVQELLTNGKVELEPIPELKLQSTKQTIFNLDKIKTYVYILTFNFPQQLRTLLETFAFEEHREWLDKTQKVLIDNSTDPEAKIENQKIAKEYGFVHYQAFDNIGINGGRQYAAEHFDTTDGDFYIFFEDDMCLHNMWDVENRACRNGFVQYVPNLLEKIQKIMIREKFDFLKLSFTEVYMDNNVQCSWYNVPQNVRDKFWPNYNTLPVSGLDPNCPRTKFDEIGSYEGLSFATGEIYYCNWPMIVNKEGNKKMFLTTKWARPYEQTYMSYIFQETKAGNIKPAILLASPINHNRIKFYKPEERREN